MQYTCDHPAPIAFDLNAYQGMWYMQSLSLDPYQTSLNDCVTANYHSVSGQNFTVYNSFQRVLFGSSMTPRVGLDTPGSCQADGQCKIVHPEADMDRPNMRVIDTDYTSYSINYWCDDYSRFPRVWINTRSASPSQAEYDQIYAKMKALLPSFDDSKWMEPRLIQGPQCQY